MSKHGKIIQTSDGKKYIIYNDQPLMKREKDQRVVITIIGEDLKPVKHENGRNKILLKTHLEFVEFVKDCRVIGYVNYNLLSPFYCCMFAD